MDILAQDRIYNLFGSSIKISCDPSWGLDLAGSVGSAVVFLLTDSGADQAV